jgi:hypothetical protein
VVANAQPDSPEDSSYEAEDITVLEGLEPVRMRPGMFIGSTSTTGLHHLIWEVVDNAVDEAMQGFCTRIDVSLLADGGCRVVDNGRGIPTGPHASDPTKSAAEIVLTVLHAGGKFGGSGYKVSGGLHGVGVSVVNALSRRLDLEIDRDGKHYEMSFEKGGQPTGPLRVTGDAPGGRTGTTVTFWPDETIFDEVEFRAQTVVERLQMMAFLNRNLEINFTDERPEHEQAVKFQYAGGIEDFVRHLNQSKEPLFKKVCYFRAERNRSRGRDRAAVERELQRVDPLLRQRDLDDRGRHARGRAEEGPHQHREPIREDEERVEATPTPTSKAKISARASPESSRFVSVSPSSRVRPRPSSATSPCGHLSSAPRTRSSGCGSTRIRVRRIKSSRRPCLPPERDWRHAKRGT